MRLAFIKLVGYIGIYNGLGLNEISIDFSKCKYKKILIKGDNGCGKTTLRTALHVMPDNNGVLISNMECKKEITLIHEDIIYNIQIIHPLTNKGDRATTKAYIQKSSPDGFYELNPNGNISSYKDIVSNELSLDTNLVSLSQLSGENRGLASLKPGDRKKMVTSLIASTVSYNDMNKTFSKKSSVYKSMRNSILSKINNLGNIESLISSLNSADVRYNKLNEELTLTKETISMERTKISMLDKNNEIQNRFAEISSKVKMINNQLQDMNIKLSTAINKIDSGINKETINTFYQSLISKQSEFEMIIKVNESKIDSVLHDREREANQLQELNGKLKSLESENMTKTSLKSNIVSCNKNIDYYKRMINQMKIRNINDISKEEFILALDVLHDIEDTLLSIKDEYSYEVLNMTVAYIKGELSIRRDFNEIDDIDYKIKEYSNTSSKYKELISIASILENRPIDCTIDTCPLIEEAIKANELNPLDNYNKLINEIKVLEERKEKILQEKELYMNIEMCSRTISTVMRNIDRNTSIIRKLILDERFMDSNRIMDLITNSNIFKEVNTIYKYLDMANIIDCYKSETKKLDEYQNQLNIIGEKQSITDSIIEQMKYIQNKLNDISSDIEKNNNEILQAKHKLSKIKSVILDVQYIISLYDDIDRSTNEKQLLLNEFEHIKESIKAIKESVDNINLLTNKMNDINKELNPLINDRDKLKYSIKMYEEYNKELKEYNEKFEIIETLKKYSSPTYGIQTIFINMYMNKILSLANELLQYMFNGKYALCPFVINEQEFRIPCIGTGLLNDDISSMSTSEVCMIGMIISFAMLQQASTSYNILALDEIDGGLDTTNRLAFINIVEELIKILNVEQCFIVSHNNEINMSNCDIILLKSSDIYSNINGNVIYNYNN